MSPNGTGLPDFHRAAVPAVQPGQVFPASQRGRTVRGAADQINLAGGQKAIRVMLRKAAAGSQHGTWVFPAELMDRTEVFVLTDRCYRTGIDDNSISIPQDGFMPALPRKLLQRLRFK